MKSNSLPSRLQQFRESARITGKGALAVVLHVTRYARDYGLPLHADDLITEGSGQVLGLGKGAIQKILADHGIMQVLAEEGAIPVIVGRNEKENIAALNEFAPAGFQVEAELTSPEACQRSVDAVMARF